MNTNLKKIEVLQKAVQMLESGSFNYNWESVVSCNCGLVAVASGAKQSDIRLLMPFGIWSQKVKNGQCPITGLMLSDIQRRLAEAGFTKIEIINLEHLSDQKIRFSAGLTAKGYEDDMAGRVSYTDRGEMRAVIKYLHAWIELLQEQTPKVEVREVVKIIRVAVPASISEQAKQLLTPETIAQ